MREIRTSGGNVNAKASSRHSPVKSRELGTSEGSRKRDELGLGDRG
jgi:hypothetical protein